jgi:phosphohistidine phosphatase
MAMDLILWRHAEAEDTAAGGDIERALTARGEKQAARVGAWLARHLPDDARVLCSPARRCQQTAKALGRPYEVAAALAAGNGPEHLLQAAGWPGAAHAVLLIGHQPMLGDTVAHLLGLEAGSCALRKAGVWWLRSGAHDGQQGVKVVAVQSPDLL